MNYCKGNNCSRCGACCTPFLPMTKKEVKTVKEYLKKHPDVYKRGLENPIFHDDTAIISCCFYDREKKECMIYPVRPFICQVYKCNQPEQKWTSNKMFAINKADYNTNNPASIADFRSLFFDDPRLIILGAKHFMQTNDLSVVYNTFKKIGREDVAGYLAKRFPVQCSSINVQNKEDKK